MSVFTDPLSQQFQTLTPDLRGYGRSRASADFQMQDHLDDLEAVLDRFEVSQCLVLGWSLGGILALELALRLPQRVCGLILVATAARPHSAHPPLSWQDNLMTGLASAANLISPGNAWARDWGQQSLFRYLIRQHTPAAYRYLAYQGAPAYLRTSGYATRALNQAIRQGYSRLDDLKQLEIPCLMLCAEGDCHITLASSLETAAALPNCTTIRYPDVAHLFPWEIPQQVQQDIANWLAVRSDQWPSAARRNGD
ncbi:alpha/beta hydrolase [Romeria aff. gracilis LEGE 07310]|uniref:Alpha/beta hydrolase n=2 Tax=Vasconcelosia TaxID=3366328 RepID=A0A8J7AAE6_9CYAN|nr:alpha/beta hydrolase [Romeria aff. gracilis LEGE 07310]